MADPGELVKTYTAPQRRKCLLTIKLHVNVCKTLLRLVELKRTSGVEEPSPAPSSLSGALSSVRSSLPHFPHKVKVQPQKFRKVWASGYMDFLDLGVFS